MADEVTKEEIKDAIKDATQDAIKDVAEATKDVPQNTTITKTETATETTKTGEVAVYSIIEIVRFSIRPFLAVWFSISLVGLMVFGMYRGDVKAEYCVASVLGIVGMILSYNFAKASSISDGK